MQALELLLQKRFLPLFLTQFFGAFNDNAFKNALSVWIIYHLFLHAQAQGAFFVTLAGGLFIMPFLLFSTLAGQLADKYEKARLTTYIKSFEVSLMLTASMAFWYENLFCQMVVIFMMGVHSTFFGPIKYAILPQHLDSQTLILGNGLVAGATFLAILLGSIAGGVLIVSASGVHLAAILLIGVALAGLCSSFFIPKAKGCGARLKICYNLYTQSIAMLAHTAKNPVRWIAAVGISWFWLIGIVFLTQLPAFAKNMVGADQNVYVLFLTIFSVGIATGAVFCNKLLKNAISPRYVPAAAFAMSGAIGVLCYLAHTPLGHKGVLLSISTFLTHPKGLGLLVILFLIACAGGLYTVPLYALLQTHSPPAYRSRTIASNNILNALFMVAGTALSLGILALHGSVHTILMTVGILNIGIALYLCRLVPYETIRCVFRCILIPLYRVKVVGLSHLRAAPDRVLIIANHVSFLDPLLIGIALDEKVHFAVNTTIAQKWWMRPFLKLEETCAVDPSSPMAIKTLIKWVQAGKKCVIFPEGRITTTGGTMKLYKGLGTIAEKTGAQILPIHISGAKYSPFAKLRGKIPTVWFPKITLTLSKPFDFSAFSHLEKTQRREKEALTLYDRMHNMRIDGDTQHKTVFESLLRGRCLYGSGHPILEDETRTSINYHTFIQQVFALGRTLAKSRPASLYVGILLPNGLDFARLFFALQAHHWVPVILSDKMSARQLSYVIQALPLTVIYTSDTFIQKSAQSLQRALHTSGICQDIQNTKARINRWQKIKSALFSHMPAKYYHYLHKSTDHNPQVSKSAAVILFDTTQDLPKGMVLTHQNLQANCERIKSCMDFLPSDVVFSTLPFCEASGLVCGFMLPLLCGMRAILCHTHNLQTPDFIYDTDSTLLFAKDKELQALATCAHPYDFHKLRYVFSKGRVSNSTQKSWSMHANKHVLATYWDTHATCMVALWHPMYPKQGTLGRLLPGLTATLDSNSKCRYYSDSNTKCGKHEAEEQRALRTHASLSARAVYTLKGASLMQIYLMPNAQGHYLKVTRLPEVFGVHIDQDGYLISP